MSSFLHLFTLSLMCGVQESCGVKVIPKYLSSVENSIISPFIFSTSVMSCSLGFDLEISIAKVFFVEKDKPFSLPQVVILNSASLAFLTRVPGSIPIMVKNLSSEMRWEKLLCSLQQIQMVVLQICDVKDKVTFHCLD